MDFFQHHVFIHARVPRVRLVGVPLARPESNFPLLMDAFIFELVRQMPVHGVARMMDISDHVLWCVFYHYVDEAVAKIDCSQVQQVGIDETLAWKGHDYISCFFDMDVRRLILRRPVAKVRSSSLLRVLLARIDRTTALQHSVELR